MELGASHQRNTAVAEVAGAPTVAAPQENSSNKNNLNDEDDGSPRRSGRARVSTTIQIDGHTVKRQNNYSVTASDYIFHEAPEADTTKMASSKKKAAPTALQQQQPKKPKVIPPAQMARTRHNQTVLAATQPKQSLRWAFLTKHRNRLEPFVEAHVWTKLQGPADGQQQLPQPKPVAAPKMVQATLRDYQLRGLEFMVTMHRQNLSMILGDEMGLGKTLQTISLLCHLKEEEQVTGPSLVICPLSVLSSWCLELQRWAPSLKVFRLHASNQEEQARQKQTLADHATEYDLILTTYDMAKVPALHSLYARLHFNYLVLDEGHKIKGHLTQLAAAVRKIHKGNTLLLTGTPLQNNLVELWSLLNFLYPDIFTTMEPFQKHFDLTTNATHKHVVVDKAFLMKTQQLLELFMLRRLKNEVEKLMPGKLETKVYCPLSKTQTFWYKALLMKDVGQLASMDKTVEQTQQLGANKHTMLRSLFMQLRKCCNHPFVFDGAEADPNQTTLQDLVASSGKLSVLDMLLQSLFKKGNRAVIFSQFTMLLDLLEDYCILRGWQYCRFDGSTERARRNYFIKRFNEPDSPYFLFLVSTRSGGMGLNLQSADTCILFDSDWNPQSDIQAMARVHRIGQTKTVHVYRLVSSGTVEERMLERAEKKLLLEMVNKESKDAKFDQDEMARGLSAGELLEDIKFGCQAIFGNSGHNELPSWEDIDNITDRSRKDSDSAGKLKGGTSKNAQSFNAEAEFSSSQFFGGADFQTIRQAQDKKQKQGVPKNLAGIAHLWKEIQKLDDKRNRKSRIVLLDGMGSGYGSAAIPVLASNNYDLLKGESSVFDRELNKSNKVNFQVKKRAKAKKHDNQDFCQVCGEGGTIALCPQCPCSVHLECVGLRKAKDFMACTHHRCSTCHKNRQSAGGILYPCQTCPLSFCEDCLPSEGVTFLERVERFDKLGFDSTKNVVYIHCSPICDNFARKELGYVSPVERGQVRIEPLDLSYNFGGSYDLEEAQVEVAAKEEAELSEAMNTRGGTKLVRGSEKVAVRQQKRRMEKLCLNTRAVLEQFATMTEAARSVGTYSARLTLHMQKKPDQPFEGYYFRFQQSPDQALESQVEKTTLLKMEEHGEEHNKPSQQNDPQGASITVLEVERGGGKLEI